MVTGGEGFLGSHIVSLLKKFSVKEVRTAPHDTYDLRRMHDCMQICQGADLVIHAAGNVGGIGYNLKNPATLFDDNVLMGVQMLRAAHMSKVRKFVNIGTVCSYPKYTPVPFVEEEFWNGYPEETNAAYGLAKKILFVQAGAYRAQYGYNSIYLIPVNMYGPRDTYDKDVAHVIPALIDRMMRAKEKNASLITIWGTGRPTREFLYVDDCARGVLLAAEHYNKGEPINLGAGGEISIRELADSIAKHVGFVGRITFDPTKPDGQPRRSLDTTKALSLFGFHATTSLESGLSKTISWYKKNKS